MTVMELISVLCLKLVAVDNSSFFKNSLVKQKEFDLCYQGDVLNHYFSPSFGRTADGLIELHLL